LHNIYFYANLMSFVVLSTSKPIFSKSFLWAKHFFERLARLLHGTDLLHLIIVFRCVTKATLQIEKSQNRVIKLKTIFSLDESGLILAEMFIISFSTLPCKSDS